MKILHINAVNRIWSTGRICAQLSDQLKIRGYESFIAYSYGARGGTGTYQIGSFIGKKLHALCSRVTGLQAYFSTCATIRFLFWMKKIKPDIVHLHNLHSNYININLLLLYLSKKNIATVLTLHDCWFFTGGCSHYSDNQCYQWQTGCIRCPNHNNTMPTWFFDRSKKMWRDKKKYFGKLNHLAVAGVSDWITEEVKKSYLSNANIIKRIYNWVDLDLFHPSDERRLREKMNLNHKFIILGVASQWVKAKGVYEFIELSKLIPEDCIILLVGKWDRKIPVPEGVKIYQNIRESRNLARIYAMSDVLVSLSREESFGLVVAEAFACGTPAIVRSTTASPELIGEGCGYVSKNNNIYDIYQDIMRVKSNQKSFYSSHCRKFAEENFNMHQNIDEYSKLYELLYQDNQKSNSGSKV